MKLEKINNKPKITDWITGVSTIVQVILTGFLIIITSIYVYLTYGLLQQTRKELLISQDPIIQITPIETVKGNVGEFELTLNNIGLPDIKEIEIFEDYFVSLTPKEKNIQLYRFGSFNIKPNTTIPYLASQDSAKFKISFKNLVKDMSEFYNSELKGHRMRIVKIQLKYRRALDGKVFSITKAYIIAGHADFLLDYSTGREPKFEDMPTFDEIKKILGVSD